MKKKKKKARGSGCALCVGFFLCVHVCLTLCVCTKRENLEEVSWRPPRIKRDPGPAWASAVEISLLDVVAPFKVGWGHNFAIKDQ